MEVATKLVLARVLVYIHVAAIVATHFMQTARDVQQSTIA